jgi:hypothetical protein
MNKKNLGQKLIKGFVLISVIISSLVYSGGTAFALIPQDHVVMVSAQVQQTPPSIKLTWLTPPTAVTGYTVYRKEKTSSSWGTAVANLPSTTLEYTDSNVSVGISYEYKISSNNGNGYICSAIMLPEIVCRGKLVLIVDNTYASQLVTELGQLQNDLIGDGWTVLRHDVSPTNTPIQVKALIQADYNADSQNVKAVFLFGHVPVCKSGPINPDGHAEHYLPWPTDGFYGDMVGTAWSDSNGDGIYSNQTFPSDIELQVGRVDLSRLEDTYHGLNELILLRRYLNKDHYYRMGFLNSQLRGFIQDGFNEFNTGEAFSRNAYGNFPQLVGASSITSGLWKNTLPYQDYIWAYINGSGLYDSIAYGTSSELNSGDMFTNDYKAIFGMMFGSYFGDWDNSNNLMRSFLGMSEHGLTNVWGGRPNWFFHHMGLGDNIGYSARITQNNNGLYAEAGTAPKGIHIALMGDPTLRMYVVQPPTNVQVSTSQAVAPLITWNAPSTTVAGYHIYRARTIQGPFERINAEMVTNNSFEDSTAQGESYVYMVKSVVLESTPSGTFYNQSQGITGTYISVKATVDYDKKEVAIFGTTSEGEGSLIAVRVVNPLNNLDYIDQIVSGAGGQYSVVYEMTGKIPDSYNVYVGGKLLTVPTRTIFKIIPVESLSFCDETGAEVPVLPQSGVLQLKASIRNDSISSINANAILAVYSSANKLKQVVYLDKQVDASKSDIITASFTINNWATGDYAKAFVINDFEAMRSLGEMKTLPSN